MLACITPGRGHRSFYPWTLHISRHGNSICWPVSLQGGAPEFLSTDPCTFPDMETPSVGLYPSREGHWSFYPWTPAHFWTWKLCLLAHIPPGRGTGVFIHGPLHISGHGNSVCWPISLQGGALEFLSTDPCTFPDMETLSIGLYPTREGHLSFYPRLPAHFWTWELHPLAHIPPGRGTGVFISTDPCTFLDMGTPSVGPYPSREGHQSFYPQTPAHFWTWELCPLARIPPGRGTRVFLSMDPCTFLDMGTLSVGPYPSREGHWSFFIHGPLHISGHGNSVHWPISLQGGAPEFFYPWTPAHFWTWKLCPLAHIPPGRGTGVFIHGPLHISRHGNSVHWPVSLQGGAPEFLSTAPCTFPDMETPSIGLYPSREGHWSFYLHGPLHISGHGNSICWPVSLQGGAPEFLSTDPCTFLDMETPSVGLYPSREGHQSFYPQTPAHFQTWKLHPLARIPSGRGTGVFIHGPLHISGHGNSVCWPVSL